MTAIRIPIWIFPEFTINEVNTNISCQISSLWQSQFKDLTPLLRENLRMLFQTVWSPVNTIETWRLLQWLGGGGIPSLTQVIYIFVFQCELALDITTKYYANWSSDFRFIYYSEALRVSTVITSCSSQHHILFIMKLMSRLIRFWLSFLFSVHKRSWRRVFVPVKFPQLWHMFYLSVFVRSRGSCPHLSW